MERHVQQTELPLSRARVPLLEKEAERESWPVRRRPAAGEGFQVNEPDLYSPWSKGTPAMVGFWNVTDDRTGKLNTMWWFGGVWWIKGDPAFGKNFGMPHDQFVKLYSWRGLKEVPKEPYICPPYDPAAVAKAIPGCAIDGKFIKRRAVPEADHAAAR